MEKKYTNWELLTDIYFTGYKVLVNYQGLLWRFIEYDWEAKRLCFYNSMQGMMWVDRDDCIEDIEIISIEKIAPVFKKGDRVRGRDVDSGIVYHVTETTCTVKDCDGRIVNSDIEHLEHDNAYYLGIKDSMNESEQIKSNEIEKLPVIDTEYLKLLDIELKDPFNHFTEKLNEVIDKLNEYERANNQGK